MVEESVRVALQSPRRLLREAVAAFLTDSRGFAVVGHTARYGDLAALVDLQHPDVALVDLQGTTPASLGPLCALHDRFPDLGLVGICDESNPQALDLACQCGVRPVPLSAGMEALVVTLRERAAGISHAGGDRIGLTDRDLEIIALLGAGHTVLEIADRLGISPRTVENRKRRIYQRLGTHSQDGAVTRAFTLGLLPASPQTSYTWGMARIGGQAVMVLAVTGALGHPVVRGLTAREYDILRSIGRGESVRQTARALGIAPKTVENTQARLFAKLGVRNRVDALAAAIRLGLLTEADTSSAADAEPA